MASEEQHSFSSHKYTARDPEDDIELRPTPSKSEKDDLLVPRTLPDLHKGDFETPNTRQEVGDVGFNRTAHIIRGLWVTLWLPGVSFAFLIFCYVVNYRTVRVKVWHIDNPVGHLSIIKAGITTISILIISVALLPIHSLISDLRSEEFFRILTLKRKGVPLGSINRISTPSFGIIETATAVFRRHCSSVFAGAVFVTFVGVAASALAPAALSVQVMQVNGDIQAFRTGAVFRSSVWNSTNEGVFQTDRVAQRLAYAGTIPWLDLTAGSRYGWSVSNESEYNFAIPTPLDVPINTRVRYLTDVARMQPSCSWRKPDVVPALVSDSDSVLFNFTIEGSRGLSVRFTSFSLTSTNRLIKTWDPEPWSKTLTDSARDPLVDGTTVLAMGQCHKDCKLYTYSEYNPIPEAHIQLESIPTFQITVISSFDNSTTTWDMSFLVCAPNPTIEAREIETDDRGGITVKTLTGDPHPLQGNLDPGQTRILLGQALAELPNSGPVIRHLGDATNLGGAGQVTLIFGRDIANPKLSGKYLTEAEATMTPLPTESITANYVRSLNGAMKPFLDGSLAVTYTPGRTYDHVLVFTSSLPHIIVSTVVFSLLTIFMIACHFRRPVPQFSFFHVATALAKSDCPAILDDAKVSSGALSERKGRQALLLDEAALASVGNRVLAMQGGVQGSQTIHLF